jgi:hypothetical protein
MSQDIQSQVFEESPWVWRYWLAKPLTGEVDKTDRGTFTSQAAANESAQAVIAILRPLVIASDATFGPQDMDAMARRILSLEERMKYLEPKQT